ncbi:MAG: cytochrome b [Methylophilaceae bacterium]|jgi:cytochrome b561|nr:cytochrome b [Methylophilaceae bacterium]MDG1453416.1 cytochrome b [Methylophilaceae bacterium]
MNKRYTKIAIILHWLIAFGILGMFAFGWYMTGLPRESPEQMSYDLFDWGIYTWELTKESSPRAFYFNLHKSIGITLLGLIVIRILWRITHNPPALLTSYKAWERKLSTSAHHLLYLLMVLVPLSGLIMSVAGKYGVKWFGLDFIAGIENKPIREIFHETHEIAGLIFLAIIVLHILGALKHKFIDKDETMQRILP